MQPVPKCPKCMKSYSVKDAGSKKNGSYQISASHMPLLLCCGHTFCAECLGKLAKLQRTSIECMNDSCKKSTALKTEGCIASLPPNVYVIGLLEAYHATFPPLQAKLIDFLRPAIIQSQQKKDMCEECNKVPATCRCAKCQCIMCGVCFDRVHSASNVLKSHQASAIERNVPDNAASVQAWSLTCPAHAGRLIEYYCEDDKAAICSSCVVGEHKTHKCVTCDEKNNWCTEELTAVLAEAVSAHKCSKKSSQLLHSQMPSARARGRALIDEVQLRFQQLHSILQTRELELCEEILRISQQQITPVEELLSKLSEHQKNLDAAIADGKACLAKKQHANALQTLHRLRQLTILPCVAVVADNYDNMQCLMDEGNLMNLLQHYGSINGRVLGPVDMKLMSEVPAFEPEESDASSAISSISSYEPPAALGSDISTSVRTAGQLPVLPMPNFKPYDAAIDYSSSSQSSKSFSISSARFSDLPPRPTWNIGVGKFRKLKTEPALITHIYNPNQFFAQLIKESGRLKNLDRSINTCCNLVTINGEMTPAVEPGNLVLACFGKDSKWYRACVLRVIDTEPLTGIPSKPMLEVLYIDYGNIETITPNRIRSIAKKFVKEPPYAFACSLSDIVPAGSGPGGVQPWSRDAISAFENMVVNHSVSLTVMLETPGTTYVDISRPPSTDIEDDGPVSVRDALVFLDYAIFVTPHSMPVTRLVRRRFFNPLLPRTGDLVEVSVCHVETPSSFYIHLVGSENSYLTDLMSNLQTRYRSSKGDEYAVLCPVPGMICAAEFSSDHLWYRAEILNVNNREQIVVRYVDYGNSEMVSVWQLRKLLDMYTVLPAQAIHCALADVSSIGTSWCPQAVQFMTSLINNGSGSELLMKVNGMVNDQTISVFLQSPAEKHSVNSLLVSSGFAKATGVGWEMVPGEAVHILRKDISGHSNVPLNIASTKFSWADKVGLLTDSKSEQEKENVPQSKPFFPAVSVSHVISPAEIYLHEVQRKEALKEMMSDLQESVAGKHGDVDVQWTAGMECLVLSVARGKLWCRAVVCRLVGEKYEVTLLDYGSNEEVTVEELMAVPESFMTVPAFALRCHLDEISPAGDIVKWSRTACETITSLLVPTKTFYVVAKGPTVNGSLPVDLLLEETVIGGALTPDVTSYCNIARQLLQKGLALPLKKPRTIVIPERVITAVDASRTIPQCVLTPAVISPLKGPPGARTALVSSGSEEPTQPSKRSDPTTYQYADVSDGVTDFKLIVTYIDINGYIYGQKFTEELGVESNQLLQEMQNQFAFTKPQQNAEWVKGQMVAAQFSQDDYFYRAQVIGQQQDGLVKVYYVDFGNVEVLEPAKLRSGEVFPHIPFRAYRCRLHRISWLDESHCPPNVIMCLNKLICNQHCNISVKKCQVSPDEISGNIFDIDLTLPSSEDLGTLLCQMGYARCRKSSIDFTVDDISLCNMFDINLNDASLSAIPQIPQSHSINNLAPKATGSDCGSINPCGRTVPSPYKQLLPEKGDELVAVITNVEPDCVFIQHVKIEDTASPYYSPEIVQMLERLVEICDYYHDNWNDMVVLPANETKPGMPCVAQCSVDLCWYRAEIINVISSSVVDDVSSAQQVVVFFTDYGSLETLDSGDKLRVIPADHMDLPAQAIPCRLAGVESANGSLHWDSEICQGLSVLSTNKTMIAVVKDVSNGMAAIDLYERGALSQQQQHGVRAPLFYQPLIDAGLLKLKDSVQMANDSSKMRYHTKVQTSNDLESRNDRATKTTSFLHHQKSSWIDVME